MRRHAAFDPWIPHRPTLQAAAAPDAGEGGDPGADGDAGAGGGTAPAEISWDGLKASLPAELRSLPDLDTSESFESFARQYKEQSKLIGANRTSIPGENAPLEEIHSFLKKLGRPDSASEYDLADFKPPEGLPWAEEFVPKMLEVFHSKAGLNSEQVRNILSGYAEIEAEFYKGIGENVVTQRAETMQSLEREYGAETPAMLEKGQQAFRAWLGEDFEAVEGLRFSDGTGLGDRPEMVRAMIRLSEMTGEHGLGGEGAPSGGARLGDNEAIRAELSRMQSDTEIQKILGDRGHPRYKEIERKWNSLIEGMTEPLQKVKGIDDL